MRRHESTSDNSYDPRAFGLVRVVYSVKETLDLLSIGRTTFYELRRSWRFENHKARTQESDLRNRYCRVPNQTSGTVRCRNFLRSSRSPTGSASRRGPCGGGLMTRSLLFTGSRGSFGSRRRTSRRQGELMFEKSILGKASHIKQRMS
jgi:hypothetical protein